MVKDMAVLDVDVGWHMLIVWVCRHIYEAGNHLREPGTHSQHLPTC